MADHLGKRGHRADLQAVAGGAPAPRSSFTWLRSITTSGRVDAVLEPVKAIEAAGQHPGLAAVSRLRSASASSTDVGWKSSNAGITS